MRRTCMYFDVFRCDFANDIYLIIIFHIGDNRKQLQWKFSIVSRTWISSISSNRKVCQKKFAFGYAWCVICVFLFSAWHRNGSVSLLYIIVTECDRMAKQKKKSKKKCLWTATSHALAHTYWASLRAIWLRVGIYLYQTYLPIIFFFFAFAFIAELKMM